MRYKAILVLVVILGVHFGGGTSWSKQVRFVEKEVDLGRAKLFSIMLPDGYRIRKEDFPTHIIRYVVPKNKKDLSARWLIYAGGFPKPFPASATVTSGSLGPFEVEWHTWTTEQQNQTIYHKGAYLDEKALWDAENVRYVGANRIFQFWIWGTDEQKVENLTKIAMKTQPKHPH